eukprot:TRINITY_DN2082_c0_g1_i3.p1 TRINITY_DN2082_c0_g1~~TRINITY_DN2082_c0_g1_i3.p1  ORF type:complete len:375 (+),score=81.31 TRINITY_DN2082_c0_g1_i3:79-1203(+)
MAPWIKRKQWYQRRVRGGRYGCDSPASLIQSSITAMRQQLTVPAFILLTGDFAAHHLGYSVNREAIAWVTKQLLALFPGTPIVPSVGNNDMSVDYEGSCRSSFLSYLSEQWSQWIPSDQQEIFQTAGCFRVSPAGASGLVVISLNTNIFSVRRIADNSSTDCGQLAFLSSELATARSAGKQVYVTGHIAPGLDSFGSPEANWESKYVKSYTDIIAQYTDIIVGSFFGHIHSSEFRLIPSTTSPSKSIGFCFTAPAISPVYDNNPGFHVFTYDANKYTLLDYNATYLELPTANRVGVDTWEFGYSFASAYNMPEITLATMQTFHTNLALNNTLFQEWDSRRTSYYDAAQGGYVCLFSAETPQQYSSCLQLSHQYA